MNTTSKIRNTIDHLRACQAYRAAGGEVAFTTDPAWLVEQAINRRAGWPDDPSHLRGSSMPVNGQYPRKASGNEWNHLRNIARLVNTPRLIVRLSELGEWRPWLVSRIGAHRFTSPEDE